MVNNKHPNRIDMDEKSQITAKILTFSPPDLSDLGKPRFPEVKPDTQLVDLIGSKSHLFFNILEIDPNWLSKNPDSWNDETEYKRAELFVRNVKTVNDCAERGVKLVTDYASILTKDDQLKEWLLQGVEKNRKEYKNFNIKTLNK